MAANGSVGHEALPPCVPPLLSPTLSPSQQEVEKSLPSAPVKWNPGSAPPGASSSELTRPSPGVQRTHLPRQCSPGRGGSHTVIFWQREKRFICLHRRGLEELPSARQDERGLLALRSREKGLLLPAGWGGCRGKPRSPL